MSEGDMDFNCGSKVSEECEGATIPMNEAGFQLLVSEAVSIANVLLNISIQSAGGSMSVN